jgi:dipeptidyl aminopeptidase/acylaminoacyl peptidase
MLESLGGRPGEIDIQDIKEAVAKVSEIVSTETLVAVGLSYGGYLACLLA